YSRRRVGEVMNSSVRNAVLWLIILCLVVLVWAVFKGSKAPGAQPQFSELFKQVDDGKVESVTINAVTGEVHGKYKSGEEFHSTVPPNYNDFTTRSEEHTSELQSRFDLVCRLLLEKKKQNDTE